MAMVDERVVSPDDVYIAGDIGIRHSINLIAGDTIATVAITVYNEAGEDVTSDIAGSGVIHTGGYTTCALSGFGAGESYRVHHHVTTAHLKEFNDYILIRCTEQ